MVPGKWSFEDQVQLRFTPIDKISLDCGVALMHRRLSMQENKGDVVLKAAGAALGALAAVQLGLAGVTQHLHI